MPQILELRSCGVRSPVCSRAPSLFSTPATCDQSSFIATDSDGSSMYDDGDLDELIANIDTESFVFCLIWQFSVLRSLPS